jgi:hypothetical protein
MKDWRKPLFVIAAIYDGLIGLIFLFFWRELYDRMHIAPPNHPGYVQFSALLLVIFGWMFLRIARNPDANRSLIDFGIALKVAYSGIVFFYELSSGVPSMWVWFAWFDVIFLILFVLARRSRIHRSA